METLFALWVMGACITAVNGVVLWFFSGIDSELISAKQGARYILLCWAWPLILCLLIPALVRTALGREGRN